MKLTKLVALMLISCIAGSLLASASYRSASKNQYGYGFHQRRNREESQWRSKSPAAAHSATKVIMQRPKTSTENGENTQTTNAVTGTILAQMQAHSAAAKIELDLLDNNAFQEELTRQKTQFAQSMADSNKFFTALMVTFATHDDQVQAQQPASSGAHLRLTLASSDSDIKMDIEAIEPNTPMYALQDEEKTLHELQDMVANRDLGGLEHFQKDNTQKFQDLINVEDRAGGMLLHFAVAVGSLPIVRWLCVQGAQVNADSDKLRTPLLTSVATNDPNITQFLLEQPDIDVYSLEENYSEVAQKTFAENSFYPWVRAHQSGEQIRLNNSAIIGLFQNSERAQMARINSSNAYVVTN